VKEYYSPADFDGAPKYDAHIHYHTFDGLFVRKAAKAGLHLLTVNTNFDILPIDVQFEISRSLHLRHPQTFNFLGAFDATNFASETFADDSVRQIKKCRAAGARGIKIWKNAGMVLKNEAGQYLMADDPLFDPIYAFLEKEKIPLLAHLGEPRNCWLPLERMTTHSDRQYYSKNPQFHMYLHPETPSCEQQIAARDRILERYPGLIFVGAHLGSMEWSLEELANRFDRFPNFYVDLSGRITHIFEQTFRNRNGVIDFFQTYRDRVMYGLDYFVSPNGSRNWMRPVCKCFPRVYMNWLFGHLYGEIEKHWLFFATDQVIKTGKVLNTPLSPRYIKGIRLPKDTVDRIFYENVRRVYLNSNLNG
jgi:hypothetical protein